MKARDTRRIAARNTAIRRRFTKLWQEMSERHDAEHKPLADRERSLLAYKKDIDDELALIYLAQSKMEARHQAERDAGMRAQESELKEVEE